MQAQNSDLAQTLASTEKAITELTGLMSSVDVNKVNTVPYAGSWTAPQLLRHVVKSINGMTQALQVPGPVADRDPSARVEELRSIFLDLSKKFERPEFIKPEEMEYDKQASIDEINNSFKAYREKASEASLNEIVQGLPFGPVTKLELIYFILYHTQRHVHQMHKICAALK